MKEYLPEQRRRGNSFLSPGDAWRGGNIVCFRLRKEERACPSVLKKDFRGSSKKQEREKRTGEREELHSASREKKEKRGKGAFIPRFGTIQGRDYTWISGGREFENMGGRGTGDAELTFVSLGEKRKEEKEKGGKTNNNTLSSQASRLRFLWREPNSKKRRTRALYLHRGEKKKEKKKKKKKKKRKKKKKTKKKKEGSGWSWKFSRERGGGEREKEKIALLISLNTTTVGRSLRAILLCLWGKKKRSLFPKGKA